MDEIFSSDDAGDPAPAPVPPAAYPATNWPDVAAAGAADREQRRDALERLLPRYAPALLGHVRIRFALGPEDAEDALQDFVLDKVLVGNVLAKADQARGRFRNFLLRAVDNYVANWLRDTQAIKRRPAGGIVPLADAAEPAAPPADGPALDRAWALALVDVAAERMQAECRRGERESVWIVFEGRALALMRGGGKRSYAELAAQLGVPESACQQLLQSGKERFRRMLRRVVGEYARDEAEVDAELADLRAALFEE